MDLCAVGHVTVLVDMYLERVIPDCPFTLVPIVRHGEDRHCDRGAS
jgi:hypothetical protein